MGDIFVVFIVFDPTAKIVMTQTPAFISLSPGESTTLYCSVSQSVSSSQPGISRNMGRLLGSSIMVPPAGPLLSNPSSFAVGQGKTSLSPSAACSLRILQFIVVNKVIFGNRDSVPNKNLTSFICLHSLPHCSLCGASSITKATFLQLLISFYI